MELYDKIADLALLWRRTAEIFSRFEEVKCDWDQAFYDFCPGLPGRMTLRPICCLRNS